MLYTYTIENFVIHQSELSCIAVIKVILSCCTPTIRKLSMGLNEATLFYCLSWMFEVQLISYPYSSRLPLINFTYSLFYIHWSWFAYVYSSYFSYFSCSLRINKSFWRDTMMAVALGIVMRPFAVPVTIPMRHFRYPLSKKTVKPSVQLKLRVRSLEWLALGSRASVSEVPT